MNAHLSPLDRLKTLVGPDGWSDDPDRLHPKLVEWRERWMGSTPLLLLPRTTDEVSAIVRLCQEAGVAIVPQGGVTGLVGGQIPKGEVLLSTERLNHIREVAPDDDVMVVEAGVTLQRAQEAAAEANRFFPLSLAAEGTATIGGNISTNAGGTAVLRYGTMRDLVLGIEAVLPSGEVFHGLKRLRKDNTGYDLKQLLIGAEGTLGVVTAAALKLFPVLADRAVATVALKSPADAITLLHRAKAESGGAVEAFELMNALGVSFAETHMGLKPPIEGAPPWIALIEMASAEPGLAGRAMERLLTSALEDDLITDAVVAQSAAQAKAMWAVREGQSGAQKPEGAAWKHDISVPVSQVATFIATASAAVERLRPGARIVAFGHVGDGNIHYDVLRPQGSDEDAFAAMRDQGAKVVHDIAVGLGGSISAEHGLGTMKTAEALTYKTPVEVETMRAIRKALDPKRIMNPRVLF